MNTETQVCSGLLLFVLYIWLPSFFCFFYYFWKLTSCVQITEIVGWDWGQVLGIAFWHLCRPQGVEAPKYHCFYEKVYQASVKPTSNFLEFLYKRLHGLSVDLGGKIYSQCQWLWAKPFANHLYNSLGQNIDVLYIITLVKKMFQKKYDLSTLWHFQNLLFIIHVNLQ